MNNGPIRNPELHLNIPNIPIGLVDSPMDISQHYGIQSIFWCNSGLLIGQLFNYSPHPGRNYSPFILLSIFNLDTINRL